MACLNYIHGLSTDDEDILLILEEIRQVIFRCERDFNGNFQLRFLEEDGGVQNQKYVEWMRTHAIITYLNKEIGLKREREKNRKKK